MKDIKDMTLDEQKAFVARLDPERVTEIRIPPLSFAEAIDQMETLWPNTMNARMQQETYESAKPILLMKSPTKQRAEERSRWVNEVMGQPTPIEPRDICVCEHPADQHKWLNDPAPRRSRHLRCTMCDCGHFKERDPDSAL